MARPVGERIDDQHRTAECEIHRDLNRAYDRLERRRR
jgi:hypothetical protein